MKIKRVLEFLLRLNFKLSMSKECEPEDEKYAILIYHGHFHKIPLNEENEEVRLVKDTNLIKQCTKE